MYFKIHVCNNITYVVIWKQKLNHVDLKYICLQKKTIVLLHQNIFLSLNFSSSSKKLLNFLMFINSELFQLVFFNFLPWTWIQIVHHIVLIA
jgi:hypothetical protein